MDCFTPDHPCFCVSAAAKLAKKRSAIFLAVTQLSNLPPICACAQERLPRVLAGAGLKPDEVQDLLLRGPGLRFLADGVARCR